MLEIGERQLNDWRLHRLPDVLPFCQPGVPLNTPILSLAAMSSLPTTWSVQLLLRYQTHVNTEYCNKSNLIKSLFKYVNKGPDKAKLKITNIPKDSTETPVIDEIKQYYDCRYISPCEAVWRIFC